jgi:hypothetical protein
MTTISVDTFSRQIDEAKKNYERHVICLGQLPEELDLKPLVEHAILAFSKRPRELRHAVALNGYITVILSKSDSEVPHCAIYFNLHSPYLHDARFRSTRSLPTTPERPSSP